MNIPVKAEVMCNGVRCGKSICLLIDPTWMKITHLVVRESQAPHRERLVPVGFIKNTSQHEIILSCFREDLAQMEEFVRHEFVAVDEPIFTYSPDEYMLWPEPTMFEEYKLAAKREIVPPGELPIHVGARVMCTDGKVGEVEDFLIHPEDDHITHIVLTKGHLWGHEKVAIPIGAIDHLEKDIVYLKLDKGGVKAIAAMDSSS